MASTTRRLLAGMVVLLVGCARIGDTGSTGTASPTAHASDEPPATATPNSSPTTDDSPSPTTPPPNAPSPSPSASQSSDEPVLAAQFSAFVGAIGGPSDCTIGVEATPHVGLLEASQLSIGEAVDVCFVGFDLPEQIQLEVEWPGGGRTVEVVFSGGAGPVDLRDSPGPLRAAVDTYDGAGHLPILVRPGTPRGDWRLTATQGEAVATVDLVSAPAAAPTLRRTDAPDDTLRFLVSGFPPGETPVGLYHLPEPTTAPGEEYPSDHVTATLERPFGTVVADDDGAGVLELDVGDLGPGTWCIDTAATIDNDSCEAKVVRAP
ncbi:hypothetical protein [Salsipaludibacter albus]|uniref:hypothetical protein n=1 Tax=Salsipaludibacter albus TaxID=2849650 RepID=UPI001EE3D128|nr:hypothetical protein [Salsipaludibacter albus]MBY5163488.1 hypothetical protein [Salsipaludibacter albus]